MDPDSLTKWRSRFPVTGRWTYLDHAVIGPLSRDALAAARGVLERQAQEGSRAFAALKAEAEGARADVARFIGAASAEIAITGTTAAAISTVANGLDWRSGDSVVLAAVEYPANVYPWLNLGHRGVSVRVVQPRAGRVAVDDLIAACDPRTRVVALSLVQFTNGYRADVAALGAFCRARGILLAIDAMQAVGALALDVRRLPIDCLATASQKWLCGPFGVGWLYVRGELIERIRPSTVGLLSVTPRASYLDHRYAPRADAARFEHGVLNLPGVIGAGAAARLLAEVGIDAIEARIHTLAARLDEGLRRRGCAVLSPRDRRAECSGIVAFAPADASADDCGRRLADAGIVTSLREGAIRVSPHFYNTEDEIDRLLDAL